MRRRDFITLLGGAVAGWPLAAQAQQSAKILHVGFLYPGPLVGAAPRITSFTSGLQAGGLRVPDQVIVIPSVTDGNAALLAPMATDLVARKVDAFLVVGPEAVRTARAATTTIPIVAIDLESDPTAIRSCRRRARHRLDDSDLKTSRTILLDKDDWDLFGDGTVVIKSTPGHTPGHNVLFLKLKKTGPVVLSGNLYHYPEERRLNRLPVADFNKEQRRQREPNSRTFSRKRAPSSGSARIVANAKLKKAPAFYE